MKNTLKTLSFIAISTALLCSSVFAATEDNARDSIPACDKTQIAIFNGASFDGNVYLHETDVKLSPRQTATVRALAAQGTPAICLDNGTVIVTLATK
jgi:hypothetical protein